MLHLTGTRKVRSGGRWLGNRKVANKPTAPQIRSKHTLHSHARSLVDSRRVSARIMSPDNLTAQYACPRHCCSARFTGADGFPLRIKSKQIDLKGGFWKLHLHRRRSTSPALAEECRGENTAGLVRRPTTARTSWVLRAAYFPTGH